MFAEDSLSTYMYTDYSLLTSNGAVSVKRVEGFQQDIVIIEKRKPHVAFTNYWTLKCPNAWDVVAHWLS